METPFAFALVLAAFTALPALADGPGSSQPQIFQRQSLIHWTVSLGMIPIGMEAPGTCDQAQQAQVEQAAAQAAQNDCAAAGYGNCFIKSQLIEQNGTISDETLREFNQPPTSYLGPEAGCVGSAIVYGYR